MNKFTKIVLGVAVLASTSLMAMDGAVLYKKCAGCHGVNGEKKALGKSAIIKGWAVDQTVAALKGYKAGTYGGAMKGVMKGQVSTMSDEQMNAIATYLAK